LNKPKLEKIIGSEPMNVKVHKASLARRKGSTKGDCKVFSSEEEFN